MVATNNLSGEGRPRHTGPSSDEIDLIVKIMLTKITVVRGNVICNGNMWAGI